MTEKINGQGFRPVEPGSTRRTDRSGSSSARETSATSDADTRDTVNVERAGLLISRLEEAMDSVPVVDVQRVQAVRDAIASGNYQIDPYLIADKILRLEREIE
ncbi:MAG: flagellar biosynthesis anti-sigma factor FlgM [Gammaproteobacteria bacterium]|nr:flagellar biosynthesis anti-sigma factor FlgM [Gammaproteobacteria bacterium]